MAVYHYVCPKCELFVKTFKKGLKCNKCGTEMVRNSTGSRYDVKEVLDNGIMARRVERLKDIEEIMKDRSRTDIKKRFGND